MNETPNFWWRPPGAAALALAPLSWAYGRLAAMRMAMPPRSVSQLPVLCIGNFIVGGAGKTPTALALADAAKKTGFAPGFLSRGYGGQVSAPCLVDRTLHNAHDVGDEPLLLAARHPTVVAADRPKGAALLEQQGVDLIIMDDGFQNPSLRKDYSLVVVDAMRGIGNGYAMPGGPLRAEFETQLSHADAVLVIGEDDAAQNIIRAAARRAKPVYLASLKPVNPRKWKGRKILAFAGIGNPDKFFTSLTQAGAELIESRRFGDHHRLVADEIDEIIETADRNNLEIATTAKDAARLEGVGAAHAGFLERVAVFKVRLTFENPAMAAAIVEQTVRNARTHRLDHPAG